MSRITYTFNFENDTLTFKHKTCFGDAKNLKKKLEWMGGKYPENDPFKYYGNLLSIDVQYELHQFLPQVYAEDFTFLIVNNLGYIYNTKLKYDLDKYDSDIIVEANIPANQGHKAIFSSLAIPRAVSHFPNVCQLSSIFADKGIIRYKSLAFAISHYLKSTDLSGVKITQVDPEHSLFHDKLTIDSFMRTALVLQTGRNIYGGENYSSLLGFQGLQDSFWDNDIVDTPDISSVTNLKPNSPINSILCRYTDDEFYFRDREDLVKALREVEDVYVVYLEALYNQSNLDYR